MRRFLPTLRTKPHPATADSEHKVVLADYYTALASSGLYGNSAVRPWPVERAVTEAYERLVWIFKSVEAIAGHASKLPFQIKQGEETLDDHPLYRVLNKRANPLETGRQFRKRLSAQVLLSKRGAFVEVTKSRGGDIVRLDLLPPGRTRPVPGSGQELVDHYEVIKQDGSKRQIDVESVRWLREPHPLDPYCGVTPLEAAGLSVELDFFTRLYNVSFMRNDGRPGGVLAIDGEMDENEMDRVEDRFGKGPAQAGKLTVISGKVSYVDVAARPRDIQYQQTSKSAKNELLCAFGVPESILGFAADRTYANADAEAYNFWSVTMPPHLDLLATGFDEDSEDNLEGFFDTSEVEVLQRTKIARREEARAEFDMGLITVDEYRDIAGHELIDIPQTRALYIPTGKTPVPTSDKDAEAFGLGPEPPPAAPEPESEPTEQEETEPAPEPESKPPEPAPAKTLRLVVGKRPVTRVIETKQADTAYSEPDQQAHDKLEAALAAALTALTVRLTERAVARLGSPKARKGTRHWVSKHPVDTGVGAKALNAEQAIDEDRWQNEAEQTARPIVTAAAAVAAAALLRDLGPPGVGDLAADDVDAVAAEVVGLIGASAAKQAEHLVAVVQQTDTGGASIEEITTLVRDHEQHLSSWADGVAAQAATATVSGARDAAAQALADETGGKILRQWRSRRDAKVRETHAKAHGQHQPLGELFKVGEARLRYPGDPSGPPGETYNCRCVLNHRAQRTGRYVPKPKQLAATGSEDARPAYRAENGQPSYHLSLGSKAAVGGRHVPGTPYEWWHGWKPRTAEVARRWRKPFRPNAGRGSLRGVDLEELSDNDIVQLYSKHVDDAQASAWLIREMERRDAKERREAEARGFEAAARDVEETAEDRKIAALVADGWEYRDAYAEVYDKDPAALEREERRSAIAAQAIPGETLQQTTRRLYGEWVHAQYLEADAAARGVLLNSAGIAAKVEAVSLFSGPAARARKYASEELLRWWADGNPRMTYTEFAADALGYRSDVEAARRTREGRSGREFGV